MTFNAGLLNTSLATDVIGNTKLDLATPVNIYTSLQANKRANQAALAQQKLSDLTLSDDEKARKKAAQRQQILQSSLNPDGTINAEKAIAGLNKIGDFDAANGIQDRMFKVAEERKKAQDIQVLELGKMASAVLDAPNPVEAFAQAKIDAEKRGLKLSKGLLNYMPVAEELADGRIDPNVKTELQYYLDRSLTPEQKLDREKARAKEVAGAEEYGLQPIYGKDKSGNTVAFQASKTGGIKQIELPQGIELTPGVQVTNLGDSVGILDKSGKVIAKVSKGMAPGQQEELNIKKEKAAQDRLKFAQENKAYTTKNSNQIKSIDRYLDKAKTLLKNPNLAKTSGAARVGIGGSKVPLFATAGKDAQADLDFLVSAGVIETMAKLKAESPTGSTGFGALSAPEMQTLKDSFSILGSPETSYEKKKEALTEIIKIMEDRAIQQRNIIEESDGIVGPEKTDDQKLDEGIDEL